MKLVHPSWPFQVDFSDGKQTLISIENPRILRKFISELEIQLQGESGEFVLSEDSRIIPLEKHLFIIPSPIIFQIEDKRIQTRLQAMLKTFAVSCDLVMATNEIISALEKYAEIISDCFPLRVRYELPEISTVLKALGFEPEYEFENALEKLLEYMNLLYEYCGITGFVIVGLSMYFDSDEIHLLLSECRSLKHSLLFVEGRCDECFLKTLPIHKLIIDYDGCVIDSEG